MPTRAEACPPNALNSATRPGSPVMATRAEYMSPTAKAMTSPTASRMKPVVSHRWANVWMIVATTARVMPTMP